MKEFINNHLKDKHILELYKSVDDLFLKIQGESTSKINLLELKEEKTGDTYLHRAIKENVYELVEYLLKKKVNINSQNLLGETPLHLAIKNSNKDIIKLLLNKGAIIDIDDFKKYKAYKSSIISTY